MERTTLPRRLAWQLGRVVEIIDETPRCKSLVLDVPGWTGHIAGQHVDVRLTAEDGYQSQRSYSIASPPEARRITLTVERLDDGEVSPYLTDGLQEGDQLELRGPIGGYFTWQVAAGGAFLLVGRGPRLFSLVGVDPPPAPPGRTKPAHLPYPPRAFKTLFFL